VFDIVLAISERSDICLYEVFDLLLGFGYRKYFTSLYIVEIVITVISNE